MPTIRTANFDAMDFFYRTKLAMRPVLMEPNRPLRSAWFKDFSTEIHIDEVKNQYEVEIYGNLILWAKDLQYVAKILKLRGITISVRKWEAGEEILVLDPDENTLVLRPEVFRPPRKRSGTNGVDNDHKITSLPAT